MKTIESIELRCPQPAAQETFYRDVLGMRTRADGTLGYAEPEAGLRFSPCDASYRPSPNDLYWKISIAVPDVEHAQRQLAARGIEIAPPEQFLDIGYVAHFSDPAGFAIELIDHAFAGERRPSLADGDALGGGPHLNLLTLRTGDIDQTRAACTAAGLTLLSVQPADGYAFTLYFFGVPDAPPPSAEPIALENRTWLYRQPDTLLEIQHRHAGGAMTAPGADEAGYAGARLAGVAPGFRSEPLRLSG